MADACSGTGGAIVGGVLGGLAGSAIAGDLDCQDRPYAAQAYDQSFQGEVGHRYGWSNGPNHGYVMTNREFDRGPRRCRDFTQVVYRHGREYDRMGTACRRPNGEWEFL
jgi:surface antigen